MMNATGRQGEKEGGIGLFLGILHTVEPPGSSKQVVVIRADMANKEVAISLTDKEFS